MAEVNKFAKINVIHKEQCRKYFSEVPVNETIENGLLKCSEKGLMIDTFFNIQVKSENCRYNVHEHNIKTFYKNNYRYTIFKTNR